MSPLFASPLHTTVPRLPHGRSSVSGKRIPFAIVRHSVPARRATVGKSNWACSAKWRKRSGRGHHLRVRQSVPARRAKSGNSHWACSVEWRKRNGRQYLRAACDPYGSGSGSGYGGFSGSGSASGCVDRSGSGSGLGLGSLLARGAAQGSSKVVFSFPGHAWVHAFATAAPEVTGGQFRPGRCEIPAGIAATELTGGQFRPGRSSTRPR